MKIARRAMAGTLAAATCWAMPAPADAGEVAPDLQVTAKPWTEYFVDNGPRGESPGDTFGFTEKLFQRGERVGRDAVECTIKRVTRQSFTMQCVGTLTLRGRGQITIQGAITFSETSGDSFSLAVTGGTGEFRGVNGEMVVVERDGPDRYLLYFD
ncbi:hypothetical protein G7072_10160 [Nocardioides sp. HDW12B]|uniref:allene oxide cyclase barrel-like domain-containing protein n=1 Tax=Nocardioides sp. HDW12B TaxID=2714939 RepID=UPI00140DC664|nr:hypothetical protein [Nocardioides sp. HDW12B]QIK66654.1 hypothetical protein G7072_10160 [Nocardioides sp. HDW12B]